jgi:hypothetical protein
MVRFDNDARHNLTDRGVGAVIGELILVITINSCTFPIDILTSDDIIAQFENLLPLAC